MQHAQKLHIITIILIEILLTAVAGQSGVTAGAQFPEQHLANLTVLTSQVTSVMVIALIVH